MSTATKAEPPLAAAQSAPAVPSPEPLRIDPDDRKPRAKIATKRYWVGLLLSAPIENCSRGGVSFSKYLGFIEYAPNGTIANPASLRLGDILELTDEQVKVALQRIASTVVRTIRSPEGRVTSARLISTKWLDAAGKWVGDDRHDPIEGDEPLGSFLYVVQVQEGVHVARDFGSALPAPLVR